MDVCGLFNRSTLITCMCVGHILMRQLGLGPVNPFSICQVSCCVQFFHSGFRLSDKIRDLGNPVKKTVRECLRLFGCPVCFFKLFHHSFMFCLGHTGILD